MVSHAHVLKVVDILVRRVQDDALSLSPVSLFRMMIT